MTSSKGNIYHVTGTSWWRHQMETFSALLAICAGNSPVTGEFPAQRLVTRSFDVFFDVRLNKRLSKQSCGWWFEMLSCPLWSHCNVVRRFHRSQINYLHKGQWRGALMFSFICACTNVSVNNRDTGDSRRHFTHFDVTVMNFLHFNVHLVLPLWRPTVQPVTTKLAAWQLPGFRVGLIWYP